VTPRFLLDTHIVVWWLTEPRKLSNQQLGILNHAAAANENVAVRASTLIEIAFMLRRGGSTHLGIPLEELFCQMDAPPSMDILPITREIAPDIASLAVALRDPADCAIVATARVHGLRLLTSDQRVIQSRLVPVIE
jgi:PIN domain nuclease of toxin-antitoxin system